MKPWPSPWRAEAPDRRGFLAVLLGGGAAACAAAAPIPASGATASASVSVSSPASATARRERLRGLLLGGFIGDAVGGPIEFQAPQRVHALAQAPKRWEDGEVWDAAAAEAAAGRLRLRSYAELRPEPESYAHWTPRAEAGTVTDDSRHKLVLVQALRNARAAGAWPLDRATLARAYLAWPQNDCLDRHPAFRVICDDWLREWRQAARWVLGDRDRSRALPPERLWTGLPTCCGQMTLPPLAALHVGKPEAAYLHAYDLAFFDNGFGLDLNCSLVAVLAEALSLPAPATPLDRRRAWSRLQQVVREVDPYRYANVPWTPRPAVRWLDLALQAARAAEGRPARLFARLEREFAQTIKWEAQVPYVVAWACLELADYEPLAALQLSLEWGHDTDSYASVVGAMIGALHGASIFPEALGAPVVERLKADYSEDLEAMVAAFDAWSVPP